MKQSIYIFFNGNCEKAFKKYKEIFKSKKLSIIKYKDVLSEGSQGSNLDYVENASLEICCNTLIMGSDILIEEEAHQNVKNRFSIYLEIETAEESHEIFNKLSEGGDIQVPLSLAHWGDNFGMCTDKFGISWMINNKRERKV